MYRELTREQYEHRIKQLEKACDGVLEYVNKSDLAEEHSTKLRDVLSKAIFVMDNTKDERSKIVEV